MKGKQGLASMSPEKRKAIARSGGKAAQATGRANRFNSATASAAGRKGGKAARRKITQVWCYGCGLMIPTTQLHDCQPCTLLEDTACISRQEMI
jgi:general stress protein YciG